MPSLRSEFIPSEPSLALIPTLQHWYAYQIVYPLALLFTKLSFLALYWRVFTPPFLSRSWVLVTACFVTLYTIIIMFVKVSFGVRESAGLAHNANIQSSRVFECGGEFSAAWATTFPKGCINLEAYYYWSAGINIVTDIAILLLPIQPLRGLELNSQKKG